MNIFKPISTLDKLLLEENYHSLYNTHINVSYELYMSSYDLGIEVSRVNNLIKLNFHEHSP